MIIDKTANLKYYEALIPGLSKGLAALAAQGDDPAVGRYEFDGGYFLVQEGDTKPVTDGNYEAHQRYIDVQIILQGAEKVGWADISDLTVAEAYIPEKDKIMYGGEVRHVYLISEGMAWVAFPQDGHKACRDEGLQTHYKKIVMKLPIAE